VVRPYKEPLYRNSPHSIYHSNITKNWLTCKEAQYMRHNSKRRLNLNIHFRMSKKPI
jgi:hypothetical protein